MLYHLRNMKLFYIVFLLLWIKTGLVSYYGFQFRAETLQEYLLLWFSPSSGILITLLMGCYLFKRKSRAAILTVSWIHSVLLFANLLYFRFYHDFITVPLLFQTNNFGDLGDSVFSLLQSVLDLSIFADSIFLTLAVYALKRDNFTNFKPKRQDLRIAAAVTVICLAVHSGLIATNDSNRAEESVTNRSFIVQNIGLIHYHLYDLVSSTVLHTKQAFANSEDLEEVREYLDETQEKSNVAPLRGIAKDKNIVLISMESLQSFVIGRSIEGEAITPFLNHLINESYYFEEFYQQTGQGKTSDSEFAVDTSMYPLPQGSVFYTQADNEYEALPQLLSNAGYTTVSFHANHPYFWNRDKMYDALGYDHFFSEAHFHITEENSVGWGLKDKPFFEQAVDMLDDLPEPFYSKFITLTNHHPYRIDDHDRSIALFDSEDEVVNRYFATVRYMDEAIELFFEKMKAKGLYEDSIFILYGDHYGLSPANYEALGQFLGKELQDYDHIRLQRVPLIIHIPGLKGERMETTAGQIDLKPTLRHMLGIETDSGLEFGHNLFDPDRRELAILRNGSFVTQELLYTNGVCYDKYSGDPKPNELCQPYVKQVLDELHYSDKIIYENLLRFEPES